MKKFVTLGLALVALALVTSDAQAFGRHRCGPGIFGGPGLFHRHHHGLFHRHGCTPCTTGGTITTGQPTAGEIRYYPEYQPATGSNPTTTGSTPTTGAAPVIISNGCPSGTCTTPRFQIFRRR
jgi:hypothetical protein